ncbi:MAG: hypothetical protein AAGA59_09835 [Actinomycetota bacterium]
MSEQSSAAQSTMVKSGLALVVSSTILTVSGFAFWLVVGLGLDDRALGEVAGLTSLVLFLAGITRLNMAASLPAVLPGAGVEGRAMLSRAYTAAVSLGVAVAVITVIVLEVSGRGVVGLEGISLWLIPLSVAAWSVFSMQDGALVAAGQSNFVAIENTAYSVVRLVAAIAVMSLAPSVPAALAAWFAPLLFFIPAVNTWLWRLFSGPSDDDWQEAGFSRLVASDFVGSVAIMASTRGFAYLALLAIPNDDGADLAVAWLFFITVDVVFVQATGALTAEATRHPEHRDRLTRSAAALASALGLVGGLIGVVATPLLLRLLIDEPTPQLATALRLIFLALMARPVLHVWLSRARASRNHRELTIGPLISLVVFVLAVIPGLVAADIVIVAGGVALSQWIMAIVAWLALQFTNTQGGGTEAPLEFQRADEAAVMRTQAPKPVHRKVGAHDLERPLRAGARAARPDKPQLTQQFSREQLRTLPEYRPRTRLAWGFTVVAAGLLALSIPRVDYDLVDGLGLLPALPPIFWLSVVCTTIAFAVFILARHHAGAAATVGLLTLSLHGIEPMSAPAARFSVAWLISGFSDVIAETGSAERFIDARFSWPGFYLGPAAAISGSQSSEVGSQPDSFGGPGAAVAGEQLLNIDPLIRFWPLGIFVIWVLLVWVFTRHWFPDRWVAAPIASWLFVVTAWTGQNYFSPQSMGTTVTAILVLLIAIMERDMPRGVPLRTRLSWVLFPGLGGGAERDPAITLFIVATSLSVVVTHPLSPVFLTLWLVPMAFAGYRYARGLPLLVFIIFLTWVSGAARPWWRSRIASLVDNVGAVESTLTESTTARSAEASFERSVVLLSRAGIVVAVAAFSLLAAGYLWRQRGQRAGALLLGMAGLPGLAIAGQPYGGEILVRVFLFSVFPAAILFGAAIANIASRRLLAGALVGVTLLGAPTLIINRYGNESFEMTADSDRRALEAMYTAAPPDTLFVTDDPFISWGYTRIERVDGFRNHQYVRRLQPDETTVIRAADAARTAGYDYVAIVTAKSQEAWGEQTVGRPDDWLTDVATYLSEQNDVDTLYRDGASGAFLIQVSKIPEPEPEPEPTEDGDS